MSTSSPNESERKGPVSETASRDIERMKKLGEEGLDDLRELGGQIRRRVEDEIKSRPFVALGVAFGAGALASSLVSSRLARLAILAAGGYAAREMFGERIMEVLGRAEEGEGEEQPRRESRRQEKPELR
jgi:hypothetical protein